MYDPATKSFKDQIWETVKPGMLLKVNDDEFFPADMIVLQSSDPVGGLFVETKNLDGETNLKTKKVHKEINKKAVNFVDNDWFKLQGKVNCEAPNNAIYKFEGVIDV